MVSILVWSVDEAGVGIWSRVEAHVPPSMMREGIFGKLRALMGIDRLVDYAAVCRPKIVAARFVVPPQSVCISPIWTSDYFD